MEYIKPNIKIVFYEDLMETITTSNPKEGDASGGRAKETTYYDEESEKIETGIPSQYHSIWEDEE
ncbi:MAG: hypothetical protein J5932_07915 [Prevotella sp.]|nr:hypothetical protein [Prevotella sp.]